MKTINIKSVIKYTALTLSILVMTLIYNVSFAGSHEGDLKAMHNKMEDVHSHKHDGAMHDAEHVKGEVDKETEKEKGKYTHDEVEESMFVE